MQTEEPQTRVSGTAGTRCHPCESSIAPRSPTALPLEGGSGMASRSSFAVTLRGPQPFETAAEKQHYLQTLREGYRLGLLEIDERQIAGSVLCVALSTPELMKTHPFQRKSRAQDLAAAERADERADDQSLTGMSGRKQTRHRESGMESFAEGMPPRKLYRGRLQPGNRRWNIGSD